MQIFLKLPKEILSLILNHIKDKSVIESLTCIPGLQEIALKRIYSKFKINNNNKSIKRLIKLFQEFHFMPSIIVGNVKQINQLIVEPAFKSTKYEVKILQSTRLNAFISIFNKVHVIGIHLDQYLETLISIDRKSEIKSILYYIGGNNFKSLTASHLNTYEVQFPNSLKQLTISGGRNIALDLSNLIHLETFNCKNLLEINSLEDLKLPTSIKKLRIYSCDFKSLGTLIKYDKLNLLQIFYCSEIYDINQSQFPDSLKILNFVPYFDSTEIYEMVEEEQLLNPVYFDDLLRVIMDCFPPKLEKLKICDTMSTLAIGDVEISRTLDCLELNCIENIKSFKFLTSIRNRMSEIIITNCEIESWDDNVLFPESKHIKFAKNEIRFERFRSNLKDLKSLEVLDFSDNVWLGYSSHEVGVDPLEITGLCFKTPELQSLILKCPGPSDCYYYVSPSIVSSDCKNLTKIELINLNIEYLELYHFPNSLEEMVVRDLKLRGISYSIYDFRNFSNLNKLKILDLQNNQITYSILKHQIFPSSLIYLNLSNNPIGDLSCLHLGYCINLKDLILKKVTAKDEPKGTIPVMELFLIPDAGVKANVILTNYDSKVIFKIVNGVEEESILKAKSKKRKIC